MKILRLLVLCIALTLTGNRAGAAVLVVPAAPDSAQDVHIQVVNQYGPATSILGYTVSAGSFVSGTVTRADHQIGIAMTVDVVCPGTPRDFAITADFDVGILPPGAYDVTVQIVHRSHFPFCGGPLVTQTATFDVAVAPVVDVPVAHTLGYAVMALLVLALGARRLRGTRG